MLLTKPFTTRQDAHEDSNRESEPTGLRFLNPVTLILDDIYREEGLWIIDINKNTDDKHIKTDSSIRKIPLHDSMIAMGFISFVEKQRAKGHERLFSDLKYQNRKYGRSEEHTSELQSP